jgi:photosystem II stability/assembly factor-like uncharacterized protein
VRIFWTLACFLAVLSAPSQSPTEKFFDSMKYRNIGPFRGGRSVSSCGVVGDPLAYYMGTTGGGLWKTEDAGQHWNNISDGFFKTGSVGAVAVSESHPYVVYCGMGEHAPRGVMTSYGDGVYKSTDAGKTWVHIGLAPTQHISRIVIHPTDPNLIYVAAQGALYGPNKERGIYKSADGGKSWKQVLFVNELTGCSELCMDMNFPDILYATMWEHQRMPWKIVSGGEGSGVYKSTDGGDSWNKIEEGLPKEKGKMAISVSRSNSEHVYALVESDSEKDLGGLFVSTNAGKKWSKVSGDNRLTQRAWYYTEVFCDPLDENTVYVLSAPALRSIDGGRSWERLGGTHGDYHDLWINPANSRNMVISNDGGAAISFNQGESWSTQSNMPIGQIYRINTDNVWPYNIYSGQQDYSSIKIASLSNGSGSIGESDWTYCAGGESAFLAFDPDNPRYVMGGSYLGTIELLDMESKAGIQVMADPLQYLGREARNMKYLFNWNAPTIWSQHEPGAFYHCAQLVLRTNDMGVTWEEFSPDLTRNIDEKQGKGGGPYTNEAVGAENYGTISYMVESPHEKGVFYTGSDDGLVHVSRDNGATWVNITPKKLGERLVNAIEVSPHDAATAYIATTRYKFNDYSPGIYKTTDYGKTWVDISTGLPYGAFTRVVREDPQLPNLLYAGTELGVYISWNGGEKWETFQLNLPVVPITDLKIHQNDLIVATSGRSLWILDDIHILTQFNPTDSLDLLKPATTVYPSWGSSMNNYKPDYKGTADFEGINPSNGVVLHYELPAKIDSSALVLEILNENDQLIQSFSPKSDMKFVSWAGGPSPNTVIPADTGLNRFVWDMKHKTMTGVPGIYMEGSFRGHKVSPGEYKVILSMGQMKDSVLFEITQNPLFEIPKTQYEEYDALVGGMADSLSMMHLIVNQVYDIQGQLGQLMSEVKDDSLKIEMTELMMAMASWDSVMVQRKCKAYDDVENFRNGFTSDYLYAISQAQNDIPRVNRSSVDFRDSRDEKWSALRIEADQWINVSIPALNLKLWQLGIGAIRPKSLVAEVKDETSTE